MKPNILFIFTDQHRHNVMGCAGHPLVQTPNLDRLAAEGARFSNVWCQSPVCQPSRASVITGQYTEDLGMFGNTGDFDPEWPTVIQAIRDGGFETASIGKTHYHGMPGRDHEVGVTSGLELQFVDRGQVERIVHRHGDPPRAGRDRDQAVSSAELLTDQVHRFVRSFERRRSIHQPELSRERPCDLFFRDDTEADECLSNAFALPAVGRERRVQHTRVEADVLHEQGAEGPWSIGHAIRSQTRRASGWLNQPSISRKFRMKGATSRRSRSWNASSGASPMTRPSAGLRV